jgi:D-sedoheptulose 7-phosphate isomerase
METDDTSVARAAIEQSLDVQRGLLDLATLAGVVHAADLISRAFAEGGKVLLFGNGGSASDASHIATEFVGRFMAERRALPALSLSSDDSAVTAIANDYGFARVFARQVEAFGRRGDVVLAISTSGRSVNVLEGVRTARDLGMASIGLTGTGGGELAAAVDICLRVPSGVTARIQEGHILLAHVLCELVERRLD